MARFAVYIVFFFATAASSAQTADVLSQFDEANAHYRDGQFRDAIAAYEAALQSGFESAILYNNLGNAHYRLDELGNAILNYERGLALDPELPEIQHSITLARSRAIDQFSRVPDPFWKPALRKLQNLASAYTYFGIGLAAYLIAILFIGLRINRNLTHNWARRMTVVAASIGGVLVLTAFLVSLFEADYVRYVLTGDEATVLTEPDELADIEMRVHEGLVFDYLGQVDGWIHVKLPNGVTGWVEDENLVQI
jgi:tetratricopeptide (TPR) repeat protein